MSLVPPDRAERRDAASSALPQKVLAHFLGAPGVAPICVIWALPASLPRATQHTPSTKRQCETTSKARRARCYTPARAAA